MTYKLAVIGWDGKIVEERSFHSRSSLIKGLRNLPSVGSGYNWTIKEGQQLRAARKKRGIKAYVLANTLGVTAGMVSQWEHGNKPISDRMLARINKLFKQDRSRMKRLTDWFFGGAF